MRQTLEVLINGQRQTLAGPLTIEQLLVKLKLPPRGIAVELNQQLVPKLRHAEQPLATGDTLEIVSLVGGG